MITATRNTQHVVFRGLRPVTRVEKTRPGNYVVQSWDDEFGWMSGAAYRTVAKAIANARRIAREIVD